MHSSAAFCTSNVFVSSGSVLSFWCIMGVFGVRFGHDLATKKKNSAYGHPRMWAIWRHSGAYRSSIVREWLFHAASPKNSCWMTHGHTRTNQYDPINMTPISMALISRLLCPHLLDQGTVRFDKSPKAKCLWWSPHSIARTAPCYPHLIQFLLSVSQVPLQEEYVQSGVGYSTPL